LGHALQVAATSALEVNCEFKNFNQLCSRASRCLGVSRPCPEVSGRARGKKCIGVDTVKRLQLRTSKPRLFWDQILGGPKKLRKV
jgi:hypothetical protein